MSSEISKQSGLENEVVGDIPVRSKNDEFEPGEMLECAGCKRMTPPNRLDCIYCGSKLELKNGVADVLRPVIRPPLEDELAYNLVCIDTPEWTDELRDLAGSMTRLEAHDLETLAQAGRAVPLARGGSEKEISIAVNRLLEMGMKAEVISDSDLKLDIPPKRLRRISADDKDELTFILFNNDEVARIREEDVELIVVGIAFENKSEADERHKRKGLDKVLHTTETSRDEILIDIYTAAMPEGFRIRTAGFDFSFLGDQKDLLAAKNIEKTVRFVRDHAPNAIFDECYKAIRGSLNVVWSLDEARHTASLKKKGFGSIQKRRVTVSSNLGQFNRYSRLQQIAAGRN